MSGGRGIGALVSKSIHMLKLTAVGACAALALGYSGAVALDGIGMTAAQDKSPANIEPVHAVQDESRSSRVESKPVEPAVTEPQAEEMPPATERQAAAASHELDEAQASPMSTGSLGDAPARQSAIPSSDEKLNLAPPSEALREERADDDESIPLGVGLAKMGPFEMPPAPAVEPEVEPRPEPRALRNVELLERPPPPQPPKLELPEERVIQIGPKAPTEAADKAAKPTQKARKSAKRKRKKDSDFLSYFGW